MKDLITAIERQWLFIGKAWEGGRRKEGGKIIRLRVTLIRTPSSPPSPTISSTKRKEWHLRREKGGRTSKSRCFFIPTNSCPQPFTRSLVPSSSTSSGDLHGEEPREDASNPVRSKRLNPIIRETDNATEHILQTGYDNTNAMRYSHLFYRANLHSSLSSHVFLSS